MCTRFDSEVNSHTSTRKLVTTLDKSQISFFFSSFLCVCVCQGNLRSLAKSQGILFFMEFNTFVWKTAIIQASRWQN